MKKLIPILLLVSSICFAQVINDDRIDEKDIHDWNVRSIEEYEGIYFFGFSEAESQVILSIDNNIICVQVMNYEWVNSENAALTGWHPRYTNYTNIKIEGNLFFSDQSNGKFVLLNTNGNYSKCLKLDNPPTQLATKDAYELGQLGDQELSKFYSDRSIKTIFEIIPENELKALTLGDLQILRNEIFARYGYIFRKGGKMDQYFNKKEWYAGINTEVKPFFTDIEKINIDHIQKIEEEKRSK